MNTKQCVVVIPVYKLELTASEIYSIRRNSSILSNWKVVFIAPSRLKESISFICDQIGLCFEVECFSDKFFKNIAGYNRLLKRADFYERFAGFEYILICQMDALIISDSLEEWCNKGYSYIGAPWFLGFDDPVCPLSFLGVGNGGLSLRKVSDFLCFKSSIKLLRLPDFLFGFNCGFCGFLKKSLLSFFSAFNFYPFDSFFNEDVYWGVIVSNSDVSFKVPFPEEALEFSFEVLPRECFSLTDSKLPFGCHAWERYDRNFWIDTLNISLDEFEQ